MVYFVMVATLYFILNPLCLVDFPIHFDTQVEFVNDVFLQLVAVLIIANSADPDEIQYYAAFHLGLHCLP